MRRGKEAKKNKDPHPTIHEIKQIRGRAYILAFVQKSQAVIEVD